MLASPRKRAQFLSKSKLLSWLQCPKRLWLEKHRPEVARPSAGTERQFAAGHDVGRVARQLEQGGVLIGSERDLATALAETRAQVEAGAKLLFEPAFRHGGVLVRADILRRRRGSYQIREVKASASVKNHHLQDTAIQSWVVQGAGVCVDSVVVQHIDTGFVYPGSADYKGLFTEADVASEIRPILREVPKWVASAQATLAGAEPRIRTGKHCSEPYDCPCFEFCASKEPRTEYPISILPNAGRSLQKLMDEGYRDVRDIPAGRLSSENQERVRRITASGKAELSPDAASAMRVLPYPRFHFDFETLGLPVPIWEGTRPYQQIPFQWSCHVERSPGRLEHRMYLHDSENAPMQAVADTLIETLGAKGPILAHNAGFERGRIEDLAGLVPRQARALRALLPRFVDTLGLAKAHFYHPAMKGSWSLKAIVPAIAPELDYSNVGEVRQGGDASAAYAEMIAPATSLRRKAELKSALERYCERDTLALVRLARFLQTGR